MNVSELTSDITTPIENGTATNNEIICFLQKCHQIAAASYNIYTFEVKILECSDCFPPDYLPVEPILTHLKPRLILYNKSAPEGFFKCIQEYGTLNGSTFCGLPSKLFNYSNCKDLIYATNFSDLPDKFNYLNTVIDTSNERLVSVLGALFAHLRESLPAISTIYSGEFKVKCINPMVFQDVIWIDNETYRCLQVFDSIQHPSALKWINKSNHDYTQGLSVFSLIEKHCSFLGASKLRHFLSSPTKDVSELKKRHEVIKFCIDPKNQKLIDTMKTQINHLAPVYVIMKNVECANVRGKHWKCIYQNIYYSVLLAETCKKNSADIGFFQEVGRALTDEMYTMAYHLDRIIDFQSMEGNELFIVKHGVCESLEIAKNKFSKLMDAINKVVPFEFDAVPNYIKKIHMLYIPEMKFLLSIPYWKRNLTYEELQLPGLEYKFSSNKTAYYKSKRCLELDILLGDPQIEIMTEEANIIRALGKFIKKNIQDTFILIEKIAELDCILAMGLHAKEYDYIQPCLVNDKVLSITDGAHPLLKICSDNFISNSTESLPEKSLVKIIYGPNSSGKTIYLKQVALITYMTHIGSFIPASEATIGVLNHIHTHLSSSESVISHSSSFMRDVRKLVSVISNCSPKSLLILDEVGKGTTEINGVAILTSCLNYLISLGASDCPHVLLSTHLSPVQFYIKSKSSIYSIHIMDYAMEDGKCVFLYRMKSQEKSFSYMESSNADTLELIATSAKRVCRQLEKSFMRISFKICRKSSGMFCQANKESGYSGEIALECQFFEYTYVFVLNAIRSGEGVTPYTSLRLQKCNSYYEFLKRFSSYDINSEGLIETIKKNLKILET